MARQGAGQLWCGSASSAPELCARDDGSTDIRAHICLMCCSTVQPQHTCLLRGSIACHGYLGLCTNAAQAVSRLVCRFMMQEPRTHLGLLCCCMLPNMGDKCSILLGACMLTPAPPLRKARCMIAVVALASYTLGTIWHRLQTEWACACNMHYCMDQTCVSP